LASVSFRAVEKVYRDGTHAVHSLDLNIDDGEFMILVGPSGCGKTTALRLVAGLEELSSGGIEIGGQEVSHLEPRRRDIAMVFQNYALYPNMSVFENIAFGLKMRGTSKDERRERVERIARILGLSELLDRKPGVLSGGQRQRVAMGRAIVRDPKAFLMDEPLSNLDAKLRAQMRAEIARIQRELRTTTIYVTHDQIEAMTMGTRVAVMRKGRLQQVAAPQELYEHPTNLFVASFIGSPSMNLVEGTIENDDGRLACRIGDDTIAVGADAQRRHPGLAGYVGRTVAVGIRPDDVGKPSDKPDKITAVVEATELLGSTRLVYARAQARPVLTEELKEIAADIDASTVQTLELEASDESTLLIATFDARTSVAIGEVVALTIDPHAVHFFDLETAAVIGAATTAPVPA
jgi:multiple sugar transport system ATP-binding protein